MTIVDIARILATTFGVVLFSHLFLRGFRRLDSEALIAAIAWAPGISGAVLSIGFFAAAFLSGHGPDAGKTAIACAATATLLVVLRGAAFLFLRRRSDASPRIRFPVRGGAAALLIAAVTAGSAFHIATIERPLGEWDAHAIWNARARTLVRADADFPKVFKAFELGHADYPLFLPASIAAIWKFRGDEDLSVPRNVSIAGLFAVLLAAFHGARRFGAGTAGTIAVLVLASTAEVVLVAQSQTADVAVAYFFLLAYLAWLDFADGDHDALFRIGLSTGLLAWTKNEGIAWALLLTTVGTLVLTMRALIRRRRARAVSKELDATVGERSAIGIGACRIILIVALGALLPLAAVAAFKIAWAPSNDLVRDGEASWRSALADPARRKAAIEGLADELSPFATRPIHVASGAYLPGSEAHFGRRRWGFVWPGLAIALLLAVGKMATLARSRSKSVAAAGTGDIHPRFLHAVLSAMVFSGAFAIVLLIYTATPRTQLWHIDTSMHRIILQFFPALVVAIAHFVAPTPSADQSTNETGFEKTTLAGKSSL